MAETLPLTSVRTDGNTQAREALDLVVMAEYAEAMKRGDTFPPIDVYFDGAHYWLADGFHRVQAAQQASQEVIEVIVHEGGQREALLHAAGANTTHGVRRSNADKRKAVTMLLQDDAWREWSDREIARHCAVSNRFVTTLRHELSVNGSQIAARKVRRGKATYTMDTGRIGTPHAPQPTPTLPADHTREIQGSRAGAEPTTTPSASAAVPQREATAPALAPPALPPAVAAPQAAKQEESVAAAHVPALMVAWEQASDAERQEFVTQHRAALLELLTPKEEQVPTLPPGAQAATQPEHIVTALRAATAPLSLQELEQVPGINRRVLGRNLTRLCDAGRIAKTADGHYVLRAGTP